MTDMAFREVTLTHMIVGDLCTFLISLVSIDSFSSLHHAGRKYHKHCREDPWIKRKELAKSRHQEILKKNALYNDHEE